MNYNSPEFLYMVLILPSLFGLTLIGEGLNKVLNSKLMGIVSIIFGLMFIGVVVFAYIFISNNSF
jgi:hypothetical protein